MRWRDVILFLVIVWLAVLTFKEEKPKPIPIQMNTKACYVVCDK